MGLESPLRAGLAGLDPTTYARGHALFEERSDQRAMIISWLGGRLTRRAADPSLAVLSVGCGDGSVDRPLAVRAVAEGPTGVRSWTGVEPHRPSAEAFISSLTDIVRAECRVCTFEELTPTRTYDVVTFVHSLYYVTDLRAALTRALGLLAPGGELLVLHAPLGALNGLTADLAPAVKGHDQPWSDEVAAVLSDLAADLDLDVRRRELAGTVDLTGCADVDPALLDFTVQATLDPAGRDHVLARLRAMAQPGPGLLVAHPVTGFVVRPAREDDR